MNKHRNKVSDEERLLGKKLAQFCDEAEPAARLKIPDLPPRCDSCAFREGAHLANGSPATQMDAIKCVMEGREFYCHDHRRPESLCSGWAMMILAKDNVDFTKAPWPMVGGAADAGDENEISTGENT